jgi:DNA-binding beta-propeller fold protein YncE
MRSSYALILKRVHLRAGISRLAADGKTLWVLNKTTRTVSRIDTRSATSVGVPIALGKELQDISAGGGSLWIAGSDRTLTRLDANGVPVGTPITVGALPLTLGSDGSGVWVGSGGDNSISRVTVD